MGHAWHPLCCSLSLFHHVSEWDSVKLVIVVFSSLLVAACNCGILFSNGCSIRGQPWAFPCVYLQQK